MHQDSFYHICSRANGNDLLFRRSSDYHRFYDLIEHHLLENFEIHAYCLLPNHFHILVKTKVAAGDESRSENSKKLNGKTVTDLCHYSLKVKNMLTAYAKFYNLKYYRKGSLFMRPFRRRRVENESDYNKMIHYIHANPIHHNYVDSLSEWNYCSYTELLARSESILSRDYVIKWFGGRDRFIEHHNRPIQRKKDGMYIDDFVDEQMVMS